MSKSRDLADLPAGSGDINIDDGTLFVDASEGNVGIGTTSPTTRLQIGDGTADSGNVITFGQRVTSAQANLPLIGHTSSDGDRSDLGLCATSSGGCIIFYTGNGESGFGAGSNAERMRIDNGGNLELSNSQFIKGTKFCLTLAAEMTSSTPNGQYIRMPFDGTLDYAQAVVLCRTSHTGTVILYTIEGLTSATKNYSQNASSFTAGVNYTIFNGTNISFSSGDYIGIQAVSAQSNGYWDYPTVTLVGDITSN